MALGANSYGDTGEVAALVPRFSNGAAPPLFDTTTRPTLLQVESEMDQISGAMNMILAELGFTIPVSQTDAKLALDGFVNKMMAEIVNGVNGSGRFGPTALGRKGAKGLWYMILEDARTFLEATAIGLERLGAARSYDLTSGLGYRETDESGDTPAPLFQREAFGEIYKEWDD